MLRPSVEPRLHLLPALPAAWPAGAVRGLRARGGLRVDLTWAGGALSGATVHNDGVSAATRAIAVGRAEGGSPHDRWPRTVTVRPGESVALRPATA